MSSEGELFSSAVAETLGVEERGEQPPDESLKDYLRESRLLLVLDNFEQALGSAPAVRELFAVAPGLKVLATSRAPPGLYGEHELRSMRRWDCSWSGREPSSPTSR